MKEGDSRRAATAGWLRSAGAVARRPTLWRAAMRVWLLHLPTGWWRRPPFLPVPDRRWIRFRLQTAYGDPRHPPEPHDVVTWLRWSRGWRALPR